MIINANDMAEVVESGGDIVINPHRGRYDVCMAEGWSPQECVDAFEPLREIFGLTPPQFGGLFGLLLLIAFVFLVSLGIRNA